MVRGVSYKQLELWWRSLQKCIQTKEAYHLSLGRDSVKVSKRFRKKIKKTIRRDFIALVKIKNSIN